MSLAIDRANDALREYALAHQDDRSPVADELAGALKHLMGHVRIVEEHLVELRAAMRAQAAPAGAERRAA